MISFDESIKAWLDGLIIVCGDVTFERMITEKLVRSKSTFLYLSNFKIHCRWHCKSFVSDPSGTDDSGVATLVTLSPTVGCYVGFWSCEAKKQQLKIRLSHTRLMKTCQMLNYNLLNETFPKGYNFLKSW